MLADLPSDVLQVIAIHYCQPSPRLPSTETLAPPSVGYDWTACPIDLICTCRSISSAIAPASNPDLYARIFKANFDTRAVFRRVGLGRNDASARKIRAREMAAELKRRHRALRRTKARMEARNVHGVSDEELWVIYVMLIENDGKNLHFLAGPGAVFSISAFFEAYVSQVLMPTAMLSIMPPDGVSQALISWIFWLILSHQPDTESAAAKLGRTYVLRPYVFAAHAYTLFFAPWTINDLPTNASPDMAPMANIFVADLKPRQTGVEIEWYGRRIKVCPPPLAQAAILNFFDRRCGQRSESNNTDDKPNIDVSSETDSQEVYSDDDDEEILGDASATSRRNILDSSNHDRDFLRLAKCHDPINGAGMSRKSWKGSWGGCWEGNFSFFDFDAFKAMLAGQRRALYEGPYGEQKQVWRLVETYVSLSRKPGVAPKGKGKETEEPKPRPKEEEKMYSFDYDDEDEDEMMEPEEEPVSPRATRKLPLDGPSTNAGFPSGVPAANRADLASAAAEEATLKETIKQQVEAMVGYRIVPQDELDAMLENPEEDSGLELLLTGTGHSAWGRFILRGRVRAWDGMASLVKEYAVSLGP